ncbi:hypothetical protein BZG36_03472 [Bifiguratus adelaidae]|uniref:Uncharacterized protein n=1 Tax=Bifiguratus adelaidae TaxID=1938954 RepID=A0A261XZU7_9FUNG|nr:hypothetical protein BZG36_03472 [Bifiguratus adelaidae]
MLHADFGKRVRTVKSSAVKAKGKEPAHTSASVGHDQTSSSPNVSNQGTSSTHPSSTSRATFSTDVSVTPTTPQKRKHRDAYSDRFIPSRTTGVDLATKFSLKEDDAAPSTPRAKRKLPPGTNDAQRDEADKTYEALLRSELFNTTEYSDDNMLGSLSVSSPSQSSQNLFSYRTPKKRAAYTYGPGDSPTRDTYSLSPVGMDAQKLLLSPRKAPRFISKIPFKVLDAPELQGDFYLNLVDWSSTNVLGVGLGSCVYLWSAQTSKVTKLCDLSSSDQAKTDSVTSVSWMQRGTHVAIGTNKGYVQIWDAEKCKKVRTMVGHNHRVGALAWNDYVLSSGGRDSLIFHRDVRSPQPYFRELNYHKQEVCGLKWSDDNQLASGGNDNRLYVWDRYNAEPLYRFKEHTAAVKAIAWSPHQHGLLASGGGTADKKIRFWNTANGTMLNCIDTGSQICNLAWARTCNELVSTHGYSYSDSLVSNQIILWKYPTMQQVTTLTGLQRELNPRPPAPKAGIILLDHGAGHLSTMRIVKTPAGLLGCKIDEMHFTILVPLPFRGHETNALDNATDEPAYPPPEARMLVGKAEVVQCTMEETEMEVILETSAIALHIHKLDAHLEARTIDGTLYWSQRRSDLFTTDIIDTSVVQHHGRSGVFEAFDVRSQEEIFGLGERFDSVARKGRIVDFWNYDAIGTSNTRTYINVPYLWSTAGYGMFLNSSARTEWSVGVHEGQTLGFAIEDTLMDYFIIQGQGPKEIISSYQQYLTGRSPMPPIWSFGLWMSRNSYKSWEVVDGVIEGLKERQISADVLHLDTFWFKEDWNPDLRFDMERFASPQEKMAEYLKNGYRISLWQYPHAPPREDNELFLEGLEDKYFVTASKDSDKLYEYPEGTTGVWIDDVTIDFTNPKAHQWYTDQIKELARRGAAAFKTDFGEGAPEDGHYANMDGSKIHNLFSLIYNSAISESVRSVRPEECGFVWARSGTAGSQRYPVHWGGDSQVSWSGLYGTLKAALSIGLSGFPFFSHDIGGFIGRPTPELYIRWSQFGLLCSHSRTHGAGTENSREPWSFGEEANTIFKKFDDLRYSLLPYIYVMARKASQTGAPMVRALIYDFSSDKNTWHIDDQYMFGDALLVAPILESLDTRTTRDVYLPAGTWYDYWTKETIQSAGEVLPYTNVRLNTQNTVGNITRLEFYGQATEKIFETDVEILRVSRNGSVEIVKGPDSVVEDIKIEKF